ncbi:MAG: DUF4249 domain-containing protein [Bacteroidales bacterium]|nr:DUF4249 domain-containing protein [Bacteroidales bacterium]
MNKIFIKLLVLLIIFNSCELVINIDLPDKEKNLIINSFFCPDSLFKVNISESLNILDLLDVKYIDNATVQIFENENLIENLSPTGNGDYISSSFKPVIGNAYKIIANNANYSNVKAENIIPNLIPVISIDTSTIYDDYCECIKCKIKFSDPGNKQNFYTFSIKYTTKYYDPDNSQDSTYSYTSGCFDSDDIIIEDWFYQKNQDIIIFSDDMINGKTYDLNISFDKPYNESNDTTWVYFYLNSVSKEHFLYTRSYIQHSYSKDNPFVEPVKVYSNVSNDHGIFAGYSTYVDSIAVISKDYINK